MLDNPATLKGCTPILPFKRKIERVPLPKVISPSQSDIMALDNFQQNLT